VVKRPHENFINPKLTSKEKKIKRIEIAKRKKELNLKKKEAKAKGINPKTLEPKVKDLYVVCFTTKQSKTGVLDSPRAIECEVVNKKISKKE
jgi:6-phosphogluconolactonase (cycloisomerase 2 family)